MKPFHIRTLSSPVTMKQREIKAKVHVLHLASPCAGGSLSSSPHLGSDNVCSSYNSVTPAAVRVRLFQSSITHKVWA